MESRGRFATFDHIDGHRDPEQDAPSAFQTDPLTLPSFIQFAKHGDFQADDRADSLPSHESISPLPNYTKLSCISTTAPFRVPEPQYYKVMPLSRRLPHGSPLSSRKSILQQNKTHVSRLLARLESTAKEILEQEQQLQPLPMNAPARQQDYRTTTAIKKMEPPQWNTVHDNIILFNNHSTSRLWEPHNVSNTSFDHRPDSGGETDDDDQHHVVLDDRQTSILSNLLFCGAVPLPHLRQEHVRNAEDTQVAYVPLTQEGSGTKRSTALLEEQESLFKNVPMTFSLCGGGLNDIDKDVLKFEDETSTRSTQMSSLPVDEETRDSSSTICPLLLPCPFALIAKSNNTACTIMEKETRVIRPMALEAQHRPALPMTSSSTPHSNRRTPGGSDPTLYGESLERKLESKGTDNSTSHETYHIASFNKLVTFSPTIDSMGREYDTALSTIEDNEHEYEDDDDDDDDNHDDEHGKDSSQGCPLSKYPEQITKITLDRYASPYDVSMEDDEVLFNDANESIPSAISDLCTSPSQNRMTPSLENFCRASNKAPSTMSPSDSVSDASAEVFRDASNSVVAELMNNTAQGENSLEQHYEKQQKDNSTTNKPVQAKAGKALEVLSLKADTSSEKPQLFFDSEQKRKLHDDVMASKTFPPFACENKRVVLDYKRPISPESHLRLGYTRPLSPESYLLRYDKRPVSSESNHLRHDKRPVSPESNHLRQSLRPISPDSNSRPNHSALSKLVDVHIASPSEFVSKRDTLNEKRQMPQEFDPCTRFENESPRSTVESVRIHRISDVGQTESSKGLIVTKSMSTSPMKTLESNSMDVTKVRSRTAKKSKSVSPTKRVELPTEIDSSRSLNDVAYVSDINANEGFQALSAPIEKSELMGRVNNDERLAVQRITKGSKAKCQNNGKDIRSSCSSSDIDESTADNATESIHVDFETVEVVARAGKGKKSKSTSPIKRRKFLNDKSHSFDEFNVTPPNDFKETHRLVASWKTSPLITHKIDSKPKNCSNTSNRKDSDGTAPAASTIHDTPEYQVRDDVALHPRLHSILNEIQRRRAERQLSAMMREQEEIDQSRDDEGTSSSEAACIEQGELQEDGLEIQVATTNETSILEDNGSNKPKVFESVFDEYDRVLDQLLLQNKKLKQADNASVASSGDESGIIRDRISWIRKERDQAIDLYDFVLDDALRAKQGNAPVSGNKSEQIDVISRPITLQNTMIAVPENSYTIGESSAIDDLGQVQVDSRVREKLKSSAHAKSASADFKKTIGTNKKKSPGIAPIIKLGARQVLPNIRKYNSIIVQPCPPIATALMQTKTSPRASTLPFLKQAEEGRDRPPRFVNIESRERSPLARDSKNTFAMKKHKSLSFPDYDPIMEKRRGWEESCQSRDDNETESHPEAMISSPEKIRLLGPATSEYTRKLRRQLDLARLTNLAIRNSNRSLSMELDTFKQKLWQHQICSRGERDILEACHYQLGTYQQRLKDDRKHTEGNGKWSRNHAMWTSDGEPVEEGKTSSNTSITSWSEFSDVQRAMLDNLNLMRSARMALMGPLRRSPDYRAVGSDSENRNSVDEDTIRLREVLNMMKNVP